jgi:hypothetical protein
LVSTEIHSKVQINIFISIRSNIRFSGGFKLTITGENFEVIQTPMMKFVYNTSDFEFISLCESITDFQMICLSPAIDKNLHLNPPIELDIVFIMDNMKIIPEDNILTIVNDPIYYPFEEYIQEINSTNIIKFQVKKKFISD